MIRSLKDLRGYVMAARDGEVGRCKDFLFDDRAWAVRYIVADTRKWLPGRKVLISPIAIGDPDAVSRRLDVDLTKDQIKESPPLDSDAPVSRQYEIAYARHYDWGYYWGGPAIWGAYASPHHLHRIEGDRQEPIESLKEANLRSVHQVTGYHIEAQDKEIGHVEDLIMDLEVWVIRYLVIDTSNWLPASKKVLVAPQWVDMVDWVSHRVSVDLNSDQVKDSPEYDPGMPVNRKLETALYDYYGRRYYW